MEIRRDNPVNWVIMILIIVILVAAVYFTWFYWPRCDDIACYNSHQEKCGKAKFTKDNEEKTWEFRILGKEGDSCRVGVTLTKVKRGDVTLKALEGKQMICSVPLGSARSPELDLTKCSGELREDIQEQIIQKLHSYIIDNVGEIGEELDSI